MIDRHSEAQEPSLLEGDEAIAAREAENALRQYDRAMEIIDTFLNEDRRFRLRVSMVLDLHRIILDGISSYAGNFRPGAVEIKGSKHVPPGAHLVPEMVEELCDHVNDKFDEASATYLAAYVLWRMNWIHPFTDGNGRTARMLSYVVLCIKQRMRLPGENTIPEQISQDKQPYYDALEVADNVNAEGNPNLEQMENLMSDLLANQLLSIHDTARTSD